MTVMSPSDAQFAVPPPPFPVLVVVLLVPALLLLVALPVPVALLLVLLLDAAEPPAPLDEGVPLLEPEAPACMIARWPGSRHAAGAAAMPTVASSTMRKASQPCCPPRFMDRSSRPSESIWNQDGRRSENVTRVFQMS
jgi:hypothetical protein